MKCVLLLALFCVAAMAQRDGGLTVEQLVREEVDRILREDSSIDTVRECASKCDAEFALSGRREEGVTDMMCQRDCERALRDRN